MIKKLDQIVTPISKSNLRLSSITNFVKVSLIFESFNKLWHEILDLERGFSRVFKIFWPETLDLKRGNVKTEVR